MSPWFGEFRGMNWIPGQARNDKQHKTDVVLFSNMTKECKKEVVRKGKRKTLVMKNRRNGSSPVELGFNKEEALKEAQRCLSLRDCESCEICSLLCPDLCITRDEKTGEVLIDLDYCKGCGICAWVCPKGAIQMVLEEGR